MAAPFKISEGAFQSSIIELAQICGWRYYHTHDSRRSPGGFPDLVLVGHGRLIFAELKSEDGRVSLDQVAWLKELQAVENCVQGAVLVRIWRPSDWPEIESTLRMKT